MATYYLSLNRGQFESPGNVTAGTSVPSADFYFFTSTTNSPTRHDQVKAIRAILNYIEGGGNIGTGTDLPPI